MENLHEKYGQLQTDGVKGILFLNFSVRIKMLHKTTIIKNQDAF